MLNSRRRVAPSVRVCMQIRRRVRRQRPTPVLLMACLFTATTSGALAQGVPAPTFPVKPVRMVSGGTPGSASDVIGRAVAERLTILLGQPVLVENRPGAGASIAAAYVARSEPDGYTINVHSAGVTVNPHLAPQSFDVLRDLSGVATVASLPNVLVVSPGRGWKSVRDLLAEMKAKPGQVTYASAGSGSATHMNAEKFRVMAGVEGLHVPFKGSPEAITDVVAGRVDFFFAPLVSVVGMIREGKALPLAVGSARRSSMLPEVPTTVEAGVAGSDFNFWVGFLAPSKTPREIVLRLNQESARAVQTPEVRERFARLGAEPSLMTPAQMDAMLREDFEAYGKLIRAAGIKAD